MKQKKRGITLIELIVVLAISGIVISSLGSIYVANMKTFKKSSERSQNQYDVKMAADFITDQLRYAKNVEVTSEVKDMDPDDEKKYNNIYLSESSNSSQIVYSKKGITASVPGISNVNDYTLEFSKVSDDVIRFKVGKKGTHAYDIETQVKVLNIAETSPHKVQGTSGINVTYILDEKVSDSEAVDLDREWVNIKNASIITENIILPSLGPNGSTITWSSSNPSVVTDNGNVSRQESDVIVYMTATVSKNGKTDTKVIQITVIRRGADPTIDTIPDISDLTVLNSVYSMPSTLVATMSDGSTKNVPVSWNPSSINTASTGVKTSKGTVAGYNREIILTVEVYKNEGPKINNINALNINGGNNKINIEMNKEIESVSIGGGKTASIIINNGNPKIVEITFSNSVGNNNSFEITFIGKDDSKSIYNIKYKNKNGWTFTLD